MIGLALLTLDSARSAAFIERSSTLQILNGS